MAPLSGSAQYPDVIAVELRPLGDRRYDVLVTLSSPYDSPQRYADGWRVLDSDGTTLGTHRLLHDHAAEQPFTRTQPGLEIPSRGNRGHGGGTRPGQRVRWPDPYGPRARAMTDIGVTRRTISAPSIALTLVLLSSVAAMAQVSLRLTDVCLAVAPGVLDEQAWEAVTGAVERKVSERPALFPDASVQRRDPDGPDVQAVMQLDVTADAAGAAPARASADCLQPGTQWSALISRRFLAEGADRMLAAAPTTPGIASRVEVEWHPQQSRVLTMLHFAGPLDIPNGRCWIDDVLGVDRVGGVGIASATQGLDTSPFAEGACGRFFDYLADGGAGQQAIALLPVVVSVPDSPAVTFVTEDVSIGLDAIAISGRIERD